VSLVLPPDVMSYKFKKEQSASSMENKEIFSVLQ
jgi:hypothetical protein